MTLTQLREKITSKYPYYRGGADPRCNDLLVGICFFFEDDGLLDYCGHFEKIADICIAELAQIWKKSKKRRKGSFEKSNQKSAFRKWENYAERYD